MGEWEKLHITNTNTDGVSQKCQLRAGFQQVEPPSLCWT